MKFISSWTLRPGAVKDGVDRFLAGQGQPAAGVTLLGRWHKADCSGGFALFETSDPAALYETAITWIDVLELQIVPVVEDSQAAPLMAKMFKK